MAPRKSVTSLEDSCLSIVVTFIKTIVDNHCQGAGFQEDKMTDDLNMLLKHVPPKFHDKLAEFLLTQVLESCGSDEENESDESYSDRLMSVVSQLKVKTMTIKGPKYMELKLIDLLETMTDLEVLTYENPSPKTLDFSKLLNANPPLSNLTSFTLEEHCTDEIISVICENCKALRSINVQKSKNIETGEQIEYRVTDASIASMIKCESLEDVNLLHTSVSSDGFFRLLHETKSSGLRRVDGLRKSLREVLDKMEAVESFSTVNLRELRCENLLEKHVLLVLKFFPLLTEVSFKYVNAVLCRDFSVLSKLKRLKKVEFEFFICPLNDVSETLSKCPCVVSVSISHESDALISLQLTEVSTHCPDIEELTVLQSENTVDWETLPKLQLAPNSFQKLTHLFWWRPTFPYACSVLYRATNIQNVHFTNFGSSELANLSDYFFEFLLQNNSLNHLKKLEIQCFHTLSCSSVKQIIAKCKQLTWLMICNDGQEKKGYSRQVNDFIAKNNYDVHFIEYYRDINYIWSNSRI